MGNQPAVSTHDTVRPDAAPSFREMSRVFGAIGLQSFGGPAAQIALMHRVLVDERRWLGERQFLSALSFCMLLPGPEAMQLATYSGWRLQAPRAALPRGCCSWRRARRSCLRCRSSMGPTARRPWLRRCSRA